MRIVIYLCLSLISISGFAQRLQTAEYFFGLDPGVGNATSITISQGDTVSQILSVPISSLAQGFNKISFRVKDSIGIWSQTQTKIFYKLPISSLATSTPKVRKMEYFFDSDPGQGNGTPINFTNSGDSVYQVFSVPISSLAQGFHNLAVRAQDSIGIWSITLNKIFYILPLSASSPSTPKVVKMEYFFDADPGLGNGTPINFTNSGDTVYQIYSVPVNSLAQGFHNLAVRVQDSVGIWSITLNKIFYILPLSASASATPKIMKMEYFFDADPGLGNGIPINFSTNGDSVYQVFSVPMSSLSIGFHNLAVRVQDSTGIWSITQNKIFYVLNPQSALAAPKLISAEYFFDEDPGLGSGTPLTFSITDSLNQIFSAPMTGLDSGLHYFAIRAKDSLGYWSIVMADTFRVLGCNSPVASFSASQSICIGDTLNITNNTTGIDQWINYQWDMDNDGQTEFSALGDTSYVFSSEGVYTIKLKATNSSIFSFGCVDTSFLTVNVRPLPTTNVTAFGNTTFCQGNDVPLSANYGLGWTYQWFKNDTSIINATNTLYNATETGDFSVEITSFYGCKDTSTSTAVIVNPLPIATITSVGATNICQGTSLTLDANIGTGLTYVWKKNGSVLTGQTSSSITVTDPGNYTVDITNTNGCTNTSAPFAVSVQPVPNAVITSGGSSTICQGDLLNFYGPSGAGYSYQWIKDGQAISGANSVYYPITQTGNYQVIVSNSSLCTDTSVVQSATVNPSPISSFIAQGATVICQGDSVLLDAQGSTGYSYQWKNYGLTLSGSTDSNFYAKQSGNYSLITTNSYNCSTESSAQTITVNGLPGASILPMSSTSFCNGDSVNLQANFGSGFSYQWFKNGVPLTGDTNNLLSAFSSGSYTVQVENANNCNSVSLPAIINVYSVPTSVFTVPTTTCASDTAMIQYTGTASSGAFYNWNFGGGTVISGTGQGPYGVKWNTAGNKQISLIVSENGCASTTSINPTQVHAVIANLTAANASVCNGDSVLLLANSGQNIIYQWYQGGIALTGETASNLIASQTGSYRVEVTDTILGCSQMSNPKAVNVYPTNFNLAFSANTTSFTQPPFAVNLTNQTPNLSTYQFEWDLGDGTTSSFYNPSHSYQYNGLYTISLFAENTTTGCRDTLIKTDYISCSGGAPNPCNILAAITPPGPAIICGGDSVQLTASAGTGYSYQWVYNNLIIPGATNQNFIAKQAGNYRVIVSDAACSQTSPAFVLNHYPSIQPVVQATGQIQPCTFDSLQLSLFVNYNSYNWSTGDTVPSIYVSQTGYYQVAVIDNYGCNLISQPYVVNNSFLNPPEICIVGVDSVNHNRLIWERQANNLIDSFYIYREGFMANTYNKIGAIPFTQTSLFVDTNSNPAVQSYRYKIAAVDTCGGVTLLSDFHKTIHLTINAGLNGSWNLIWDGYQGFQFSTYRIYRGTNANNMSLLTQLPSTAKSYTDLNPPTGTVFYQIEVIKSTGCYPDTVVSKANTNYNTSRSNTANNGNITPIFLTAAFSASIQTGQWPIKVEFSDQSTGLPDSWLWDFGDGNISIEQNPEHTYNNTGLYTVKLKICNGTTCDTISKIGYINVLPNGLVEIGVELMAKLYPNPNDGNFSLEINTMNPEDLHLNIFNQTGQQVYSEEFTANGNTIKTIKLGTLAKGLYYVSLSTKDKIVYRGNVLIN